MDTKEIKKIVRKINKNNGWMKVENTESDHLYVGYMKDGSYELMFGNYKKVSPFFNKRYDIDIDDIESVYCVDDEYFEWEGTVSTKEEIEELLENEKRVFVFVCEGVYGCDMKVGYSNSYWIDKPTYFENWGEIQSTDEFLKEGLNEGYNTFEEYNDYLSECGYDICYGSIPQYVEVEDYIEEHKEVC